LPSRARYTDDVLGRVLAMVRRERLLKAGDRVLVACSGGPDSLALLYVLRALLPRLGIRLRAIYVDHGLRRAARQEGAFVVAQAAGLGLAGEIVAVRLRTHSMEAARQARYGALIRTARHRGATHIAVAHTATDQAETVLERLVRGTGVRGVGAMSPSRPLEAGLVLVRPLLEVTRAEVEQFCRQESLRPVRDPTNRSNRYLRNRIRRIVLPALRRENPRVDQALARFATRMRELDALVEAAAAAVDVSSVQALRATAPAVRARTLEHAHQAALLRLLEAPGGSGQVSLPGGIQAARSYDRLTLQPETLAIATPGRYPFGGGWVEVVESERAQGALAFDADAAPLPWLLRAPRPGDRMRPRGLGGTKKLSDLFIDDKVPRAERPRVPVLTRQGVILCAGPQRAAEEGRPHGATRRYLCVRVLTNFEPV
jgi:tRNA(Ile)-lysidine synthase